MLWAKVYDVQVSLSCDALHPVEGEVEFGLTSATLDE